MESFTPRSSGNGSEREESLSRCNQEFAPREVITDYKRQSGNALDAGMMTSHPN